MQIDVLSLFPEYFSGPLDHSILKRARANHLLNLRLIDIRDFSENKHNKVDDRPYGGGPGMVMMAPPVARAIASVTVDSTSPHRIYLSPQGQPLTAKKCQELARKEHLILLCGHYEGIDQRAIDHCIDEEISIGDYVLTNGCLAAIVLIDSVLRFVPGVLGDEQAAIQDSFQDSLLDCPHYTRPEFFEEQTIPPVLTEGDHQKIGHWRHQQALTRTQIRRPDLYLQYLTTQMEQSLLLASDETPNSLIEDSKNLHEIFLPVLNVEDTVRWFKRYLRLRFEFSPTKEVATLRLGSLQISLMPNGTKSSSSLIHLSIITNRDHLSELQKAYASLPKEHQHGITTQPFQLRIKDPNGYVWGFWLPAEAYIPKE